MRRDLDIDCDPSELVLAPPDWSTLKEMFRRFEFRALLQRVDQLDEALPAAEAPPVAADELPWREGSIGELPDTVGLAVEDGRVAVSTGDEVVISTAAPSLEGIRIMCHDAKAGRLAGDDDTMLAAYLIEPGRSTYELDDLAAEYGVAVEPSPTTDEETAALVRRAAVPLRLAPLMRARLAERDLMSLYENVELSLTHVLAAMVAPASRSTRTGWGRSPPALRADRGARGDGAGACGRGVRPRLDAAGGAGAVRDARADAGTEREDRLLDGHQGPADDPRRASDRPRDRGVA